MLCYASMMKLINEGNYQTRSSRTSAAEDRFIRVQRSFQIRVYMNTSHVRVQVVDMLYRNNSEESMNTSSQSSCCKENGSKSVRQKEMHCPTKKRKDFSLAKIAQFGVMIHNQSFLFKRNGKMEQICKTVLFVLFLLFCFCFFFWFLKRCDDGALFADTFVDYSNMQAHFSSFSATTFCSEMQKLKIHTEF